MQLGPGFHETPLPPREISRDPLDRLDRCGSPASVNMRITIP